MSVLTKQQIAAAHTLFTQRPAVIPGTRAIIDEAAQRGWFADVTASMVAHGIKSTAEVNAFCDVAGVAD